jgi:hypothetical protein
MYESGSPIPLQYGGCSPGPDVDDPPVDTPRQFTDNAPRQLWVSWPKIMGHGCGCVHSSNKLMPESSSAERDFTKNGKSDAAAHGSKPPGQRGGGSALKGELAEIDQSAKESGIDPCRETAEF